MCMARGGGVQIVWRSCSSLAGGCRVATADGERKAELTRLGGSESDRVRAARVGADDAALARIGEGGRRDADSAGGGG